MKFYHIGRYYLSPDCIESRFVADLSMVPGHNILSYRSGIPSHASADVTVHASVILDASTVRCRHHKINMLRREMIGYGSMLVLLTVQLLRMTLRTPVASVDVSHR
jgi:hypothetical protein